MGEQTEQVLKRILEDNKDKIYRICKVYSVYPYDTRDLFQEVVFQIWKSLPTFNSKSNVNTWIYRITLNVCIRTQMKLQKKNEKMVRFDAIQFAKLSHESNEKEQEKYDALHNCINKLNEVDKSIVILYLDQVPYKEISSITGLSENNVAVKMRRIRKSLFGCISNKI